jgi:lipopolysaccharide/colanic/teichoic acid biosynthesis glycosyltransferase
MKRVIDILLSLFSLVILMPLIIIIALFIAKNLGRPVIFKQARPGLNARTFYMIKFRSMKEAYDSNGDLLPDEYRMTRLGSFLRSSSLDELPGLWCVLKGDMSLVGPRPLLMEYVSLYSKEQFRRHDLKPGITGWAQVNGRNAISWEDKFKLDTWYVDNQSFWLDMKILCMTVKKVFVREGISAEGEATMSKFTGSSS